MAYEDNFQQTSEAKYDCLLFGTNKGRIFRIWISILTLLYCNLMIEKWF